MGVGLSLWLAICTWVMGAAHAQAPPFPSDALLAGVQIEAPESGLPDASLAPLLRSTQGEPLRLEAVRLDLATLYRVGSFRSVEAHTEPWMAVDAEGNLVDAVLLTYRVYPAPHVASVRVSGNKAFSDRKILEWAGITQGASAWFPELESKRVELRLERTLHREGWTRAQVTVTTTAVADAGIDVTIEVDEGLPNRLSTLQIQFDDPTILGARGTQRVRRWARREGLREGEPFAPEAVKASQARIRSELASMRRGPFRRRRGWTSARVTPALLLEADQASSVVIRIELGPRLDLDVAGLGFRGDRSVRQALGIDERLRLTRGWLDAAPERLETALQERGWLQALTEIELEEAEATRTLVVRAERGPRHTLASGTYPNFIGIDFEGNEAATAAELQKVIDQASEDVLRSDLFTEPELQRGLVACEDLYRARGFLDAELTLDEIDLQPRVWLPLRWLVHPVFKTFGGSPPLRVRPRVQVVEGPQTRLVDVALLGADARVPLDDVAMQLAALQDEPYSAQRLEALMREVVSRHRQAGFLEADARVESRSDGPERIGANVVVTPGPLVLLRSMVTRGLQVTRSSFVRRESDLQIGQPVTADALDELRANLYDLGVFRAVRLDLLGDGSNRDLVLDLVERPRWAYELGFGLSTDLGLRSFGRVSRRNLWGRAHRLDLIGQVGLLYGSDSVTDWLPDVTNPDWRLSIAYTAPRFPARSQDLVLDLLLRERRLERTWRMARSGGGPALEQDLSKNTRMRTSARVETRQLQEIDLGALLPGDPWESLIGTDLPSRWRVQEQLAMLIVHDRRDDPILPSRGWSVSMTGEWAPGLPWDEWRDQDTTRFLKGELRLSAYIPLSGITLKLSGLGGRALSLDEGTIPLEDRFRLGGTGSLRGFQRDVIGPRNLTNRLSVDWPASLRPLLDYTTRDNPSRWVPTGGDAVALGSAELLLPLPALGLPTWEGYAAALFTDFGNVFLLDPDTSATSQLSAYDGLVPQIRTSAGAGMRVDTPVGPLQLDAASNLQAMFGDDEVQDFLVVGYEEPRWRVHLTLGALF